MPSAGGCGSSSSHGEGLGSVCYSAVKSEVRRTDCLSQPYPRNTLVRKSSLSQFNKSLLWIQDPQEKGTTKDHLEKMITFEEFNRLVNLDSQYELEIKYSNLINALGTTKP
ncbi:hypothetical protein YC2023_090294 [Brassica napus]